MHDDVRIRAEQPSDYAGIDEVNRLAFGGDGEVKLIRGIRDSDGFDPTLSLVATLAPPLMHQSEPNRNVDANSESRTPLPHGRGSDGTRTTARIESCGSVDTALTSGSDSEVTLGNIIGHILFSHIRIESGNKHHAAIALAPMAVHPNHQRRGIGSRLIREGFDACRQARHRIIVVLGHEEYYPRFGFERASRYDIKPPFDAPDEAFMVLSLTPGALDGVGGTVRYPASFDAV